MMDPIWLSLKHNPLQIQPWADLVPLYAMQGQPWAAAEALKGLLDLMPNRNGSMLYLGEALLQLGHTEAAEKAFTRASHSNNPSFLRLLAERVFASNYWQEAIAILEKATNIIHADLSALLQLAKLHWEVDDLSRTQELCRHVLAIELVARVPSLRNQRTEFRDNLISSPLGNTEAYSRDFEQLLQARWQSHRQAAGSSLIATPSAPIAA